MKRQLTGSVVEVKEIVVCMSEHLYFHLTRIRFKLLTHTELDCLSEKIAMIFPAEKELIKLIEEDKVNCLPEGYITPGGVIYMGGDHFTHHFKFPVQCTVQNRFRIIYGDHFWVKDQESHMDAN